MYRNRYQIFMTTRDCRLYIYVYAHATIRERRKGRKRELNEHKKEWTLQNIICHLKVTSVRRDVMKIMVGTSNFTLALFSRIILHLLSGSRRNFRFTSARRALSVVEFCPDKISSPSSSSSSASSATGEIVTGVIMLSLPRACHRDDAAHRLF